MATINLKTLLSTFNEKGTLLKWLQQLEKALAQSVLESVTVTTSTAGSAVFSFNFADDTAIKTPPVPLPRGEAGEDGTSIRTITEGTPRIQDDFTITPFIITLTDGTTIPLEVSAANGAAAAAGKDGVGITEITSGEPYESNENTVTPITITKTEGEPIELSISAKNGTNGINGTDGNGIVTVHALRHYTQDAETITVVEAVTDNGANPQFEVHARNGERLYMHHISIYPAQGADGGDTELYMTLAHLSTEPLDYPNLITALYTHNTFETAHLAIGSLAPLSGNVNNIIKGIKTNDDATKLEVVTIDNNIVVLDSSDYVVEDLVY